MIKLVKENSITWRHWATVLFLGIFFSGAWYENFEICETNSSYTLTFMNMFHDKNLYPSSFLFKQIYPTFLSSIYYWIAGLLGLIFNPYWALYGYFVLINCLVLAGIFYLAQTITQNFRVSYLSVIALSLQWQLQHALGGSGPLGLSPAPLHMATGLGLFAIAFFLQGRSKVAFALAGFVFNIHASFSIFVLTMLVVTLLIKGQWKELGIGCGIAAIAALPSFIYIFIHRFSENNPLPSGEWYRLVRLRIAHHTMPFLFKFENYVRFLPYIFLFLAGYRMARKNAPEEAVLQKYDDIAKLTCGILLLCVIGTVFSEWIPVAPLIELTLFRSTRFFVIFSVILYMSAAISSFELKDRRDFTNVFLMAGIVSASFPAIYASLIGLYAIATYQRNKRLAVSVTIFLSVVTLAAAYWILRRYGFPLVLQQANFPTFFAIASILILYGLLKRGIYWKRALAPTALALVALTVFIAPVYPLYMDRNYFDAVKELQYWLKNNTPKDQLIILPTEADVWNGLSERGDTFTFTELGYSIYAPYLEPEVVARAKDYVEDPLGFKNGKALENAIQESYEHWDEAKFKVVGAKYGSDFAVVHRDKRLNLPLLHENNSFRVYKID